MKIYLLSLALCCLLAIVSATQHRNDRVKRQIGGYRFPGPRSSEVVYSKPSSRASRAPASNEPQYEESAEQYSRTQSAAAYRQQPAPQQYAPSSYRQPEPSYNPAPQRSYNSAPRQTVQTFGVSPQKQSGKEEYSEEDAEKDKQPTRLELLLAESKFTCGQKKDGYYADSSVACQVFHYCVGGAKHSWMCPEATVFHQVHLNCVPASQDICSQSDKYSESVNSYLHKELDQKGPNNTIRYHQRYYPQEFLGDIFGSLPQEPAQGGRQTVQQYPAPAPQRGYDAPYNRPSASSEEESYGNSAPISQPSYQPSYNQGGGYASAPAKSERTRSSSYSPSAYQQSYPSSNYAQSAPKPASTASSYAPAPAPYQPSARAQTYPAASGYSSHPSYQPQYQPAATKPAATSASPYQPSVNYASQPAYKKVSAASITPVAPPKASNVGYAPYASSIYPASYSSSRTRASPYGSSGPSLKASSSLVDSPYPSLKSGVTYEEDY